MNDRFKFRVPVFDEGKFLCFHFFNAIDGADHYREIGPYAHGKEEQCTGLKDKNGRLIYEGDIVESTRATRNNKPARDVVKYDNEFAGFDPMCCYDCDCGIYNPADELVVIGNIHENPELLEDK